MGIVMAKVLVVATQGERGTWAVYSQEDSPRPPGTVVQTTGPLVGSVASWEELDALAERHGVARHQVTGAGLDQMEQVLGPQAGLTARVAELAGQVASLQECARNGGTAPAGAGLSPFLPWTPQGRARRRPASDAGPGP